jgi:hypothetical protein
MLLEPLLMDGSVAEGRAPIYPPLSSAIPPRVCWSRWSAFQPASSKAPEPTTRPKPWMKRWRKEPMSHSPTSFERQTITSFNWSDIHLKIGGAQRIGKLNGPSTRQDLQMSSEHHWAKLREAKLGP